MSLVLALFVREGIVLASDSRLTFSTSKQLESGQTERYSYGFSDANYKTFDTPTKVGISTFGQADIAGVPLAGFIESFINEIVSPQNLEVDRVAEEIQKYFAAIIPVPRTHFLIGGYKKVDKIIEQHIWSVNIFSGERTRCNTIVKYGAQWGGETDIVARLINSVGTLDEKGGVINPLPQHAIHWNFFTLQDAIDFAMFAIRSTVDALRFQDRPKSVGGPIDVLVIKPSGSQWVQRKELKVSN